MVNTLEINEFLELARNNSIVDVRSESEFMKGHIPGAFNIPLFDDAERHKIGIIYKQASREKAIMAGLDIVGPKMRKIAEAVGKLAPEKTILLHCWRGGMRSGSVAWLLNFCGFKPYILQGGYKSFRNYALSLFAEPGKIIILGGKTGSAKTHILQQLAAKGLQVIDLEALASHKGSAFGGYEQPETLKQEQFENDLAFRLKETDKAIPLWLEDESRTIGRLGIPQGLWEKMRLAPVLFLEVSVEQRVLNILADYGNYPRADLISSINRLSKRLGGLHTKITVEHVEKGELAPACRILLSYYDKAYMHGLEKRTHQNIFKLEIGSPAPPEIAEKILEIMNDKTKFNF